MAKSDNEQAERVRSARAWLERAEKSFDNKADVRGELNLMLAEAEMKNLRKNHGTGRKIRRLAAVLTALVLALGIWQFMHLILPGLPAVRRQQIRPGRCRSHSQKKNRSQS